MSPPVTHAKPVAGPPVRWSAVLHPYRSADRTPLLLVAALVGGACFVAGVAFSAMGAWPVFGFLGLDVVLLIVAIRLNLRRAREREALTLTDDELLIDRVDHWGHHRQWSVPAHWLRVVVNEGKNVQPKLELHTHGRVWTIAKFLRPEEKYALADDIRRAVAELGAPPGDQRSFE
jgi:uncharacterized membrane protein